MAAAKNIVFVTFALAFSWAEGAYGLKWKPGDDEAVASAYLTSVNAFEMRMRQPDGVVRKLYRDFDEPNKLYGTHPWVGEAVGNGVFKILTNPEFKGGRTAFVFANGHLRRMVLGSKDYKFDAVPYPAEQEPLESLWPKELTEDDAKELFGSWKGEDGRLRIGYANPNKGGFLMTEIALAALALLLFASRRWIKALGGVVMVAAFVFLVLTQSRSAFVALVLGAVVLAAFRSISLFSWRRFAIAAVGLVLVVCIATTVLAMSGVGTRFTTGLVNTASDSDALRVNIVKAAPAMIVDAPGGWGLGRSGWAYANWYQKPDEFRVVRTLVNSHLTWLVELGWCGRFAYLGGLIALVLLLAVSAKRGANPLPLALFSALFTAGLFNSVMETPTLWLVPCASLALLFLASGRRTMTWKSAGVVAAFGFAVAGIALVVFAFVGSKSNRVPLRAEHDGVIVNGAKAKTWVVDDNVVLGGGFLGRELRMFYSAFPQTPPVGIAWKVEDVPEDAANIVVAGKRCVDFVEMFKRDSGMAGRFASITFISPPFAASTLPESLSGRSGFCVLQGELAVRRTPDASNPPSFLKVVPGAELYIPGWIRLVTKEES